MSCPIQVPESDFSGVGGVTRKRTGAPFTNVDGCQRTNQDFLLIFACENAQDVATRNARTHRICPRIDVSLALITYETSIVIHDKRYNPHVSTWPIITLALAASSLSSNLPGNAIADRVIVLKNARSLTLLNHGLILKTYKIALGTQPVGPKMRQGDHKTPEGIYVLDSRNPHSQFYKSIHISYPNQQDRSRANKLGVSAGGDIYLHGLPNGYRWIGEGHRLKDWTDGCIAVTNEEMDEIWRTVPNGTLIEIRP